MNSAGAIRRLIREKPFELVAGTLVLVPVVNLLGFERHTRYLPGGKPHEPVCRSFFDHINKYFDYGIAL
ncbi:hypothetical protein [Botrimarina colliarenosi]|uniref:hypothetical protein n=1 Tax=Botrimarina colliarenosi TaxID=2528001 RepID=UPI0036F2C7C2